MNIYGGVWGLNEIYSVFDRGLGGAGIDRRMGDFFKEETIRSGSKESVGIVF